MPWPPRRNLLSVSPRVRRVVTVKGPVRHRRGADECGSPLSHGLLLEATSQQLGSLARRGEIVSERIRVHGERRGAFRPALSHTHVLSGGHLA